MGKKNSGDVWRALLIYALVLLFAVAVVVRVVVLQVVDRDKYEEMARKNEIRVDTAVEAKRGNIYSKNGKLLAVSVPRYDIYYDYSAVKDDVFEANVSALSDSIAKAFKRHPKAYYEKLLRNAQQKKSSKYVKLIGNLEFDECKRIKSFPMFDKYNVLNIKRKMVRDLPYDELAMRTIGYVKEDEKTILVMLGLEGQYDSYLRGKKGAQVSRRLNGGVFIPIQSPLNVEPVDGCDVYTSINIELQDLVDESLRKGLAENKAEEGCVVVMDVETGFVEVMANLIYDKKRNKYIESNSFAIGGGEEPGSTFKAVVMTALLENNPNLSIERVLDIGNSGRKYVHNRDINDSHVISKDGKVTIEKGFWESSNIVFAMLVDEAFGNNPDKFVECIYKTKINEPLHLDIKERQSSPSISLDPNSKVSSMLSMSYGYAVRVSPITLCTYYNAIANGGTMYKPQFVREIRRGDEIVEKFEPVVINERIASEKNIAIIQSLLRGVAEKGTAKSVFNKCAMSVAGKTGTSHRLVEYTDPKSGKKKMRYDNEHYVATFAGYFPADNPKYSCVVMIANPDPKRHYGVQVAAPIFKEIVDRVYATSLGIEENNDVFPTNCDKYQKASMAYFQDVADYCDMSGVNIVDEEFGTEWVKVGNGKNGGVTIQNVETEKGIVPDLKGMNVTDAVFLLESMGWNAEFSGSGLVESQNVKAGTKLEEGKTISLKLKV